MISVGKIVPTKDIVVVRLVNLDAVQKGLLSIDHSDEETIAARYGEVISMGPDVLLPEHCAELSKGDIAIFTEFAGHYVPTDDSKNLYKIVRGYDIIGKHTNMENIADVNAAVPTGNRLLVEIIDITDQADGIIIDSKNPALADLTYGKILKINKNINKLNLSEGSLVAFAPYVGTDIRNYESDSRRALRILVEEDVLFTM